MTWPYDSARTRGEFIPQTYPWFAVQILTDSPDSYLHTDQIYAAMVERGYSLRHGERPCKRILSISLYERSRHGHGLIRGPLPGTFALPGRWTGEEGNLDPEENLGTS